ncbi:MAG: GNAT family N-acetyltransferase [Janthinobacterium lividum]
MRLATVGDLQAVEAIVREAYTPYVARMGRMPGPMLDDYRASITAGRVHVIEHGGAVRGVLVLIPEVETMLLDNIAVDPAAQGAGLGRRMLGFAEETARASGFRAIRLYTNEAMTENVGLYSRLGWVETHRGEENGFRRVYFAKQLG